MLLLSAKVDPLHPVWTDEGVEVVVALGVDVDHA